MDTEFELTQDAYLDSLRDSLGLTDNEFEAFQDYLELTSQRLSPEILPEFEDVYCGQYDSLEEYALEVFDEIHSAEVIIPLGYVLEVDIVAWRCDYMISDNGHVFRNC